MGAAVQRHQRRKQIAKLKELQPMASNRAIATTLGTSEASIRRDTASNDADGQEIANENNAIGNSPASMSHPSLPASNRRGARSGASAKLSRYGRDRSAQQALNTGTRGAIEAAKSPT
jgi:hypothetical protein